MRTGVLYSSRVLSLFFFSLSLSLVEKVVWLSTTVLYCTEVILATIGTYCTLEFTSRKNMEKRPFPRDENLKKP